MNSKQWLWVFAITSRNWKMNSFMSEYPEPVCWFLNLQCTSRMHNAIPLLQMNTGELTHSNLHRQIDVADYANKHLDNVHNQNKVGILLRSVQLKSVLTIITKLLNCVIDWQPNNRNWKKWMLSYKCLYPFPDSNTFKMLVVDMNFKLSNNCNNFTS